VCDDEGIGICAPSDELASVLANKRIGLSSISAYGFPADLNLEYAAKRKLTIRRASAFEREAEKLSSI
jgi:hypothetical protein